MHKKLTIRIDEKAYANLHTTINKGEISQSIENLELAYREMATDEIRKYEAESWSEGLLGDTCSWLE